CAWRVQSLLASRYGRPAAWRRSRPMRMARSFVTIVAGLAALGAIASAGSPQEAPRPGPTAQHAPLPTFKDYPADAIYKGRAARLRLTTQAQGDRRELSSAAAEGGVTFAGHYALVKFGCGSSCVSSDILDLRTGRTIAVPFTISGWREIHDDFEPIEVKP